MALDWPQRRLWLLSDAKRTYSLELRWDGSVRQPLLSAQAPQPLQGQGRQKLDGEALVRAPGSTPQRFGWPVKPVTPKSDQPPCSS